MKRKLITTAVWVWASITIIAGTPSGFKSYVLKNETSYGKFFRSELLTQALTSTNPVKAKAANTLPYTENFETGSAWVITDANSKMSISALSGLTAISGTSYLTSMYDAANSRNAWAISPAVTLTAGVTYYVYVNYYAPGYSGIKDEFKITVGTGQTSASQTTVLLDKSGTNAVATTAWTYVEMNFTPTTTGDYYFGINHCTVAKDVNAVAFEDFVVSTTKVIPAPTATIGSLGGLFSLTSDSVYASPNEELYYFAKTTNTQEYSWLLDGNQSDTTQYKGNQTVGVVYSNPGRHIAGLDVLGLNGTTLSPQDTCYLARPEGKTDYVWNIGLTDKLSIYTTGTSNNYALGLNSTYKKISELYSLPATQKTTLNALVLYVYYYQLSTTNRAKTFTITVQAVDPTTGLPGTVLATYSPTFSTVFGTTTINGALTFKTYTLSTPLNITGSFYVSYDYTNAGAPSSTNRIGIASSSSRVFDYGTAYVYYQNTWQYYGALAGGYGVGLTYVKPTVTDNKELNTSTQTVATMKAGILHISNAIPGKNMDIYDNLGKLVYTTRITKTEEVIYTQLPVGIYVLKTDNTTLKIISR